MRQLTITLDLKAEDETRLLQNSLERVLNNAIYVGSAVENGELSAKELAERGSTLWQDCEELKPLVLRLWGLTAAELRKQLYAEQS